MTDLYAGVDLDGREVIIPETKPDSDQLWEQARKLRMRADTHALVACHLILAGFPEAAVDDAREALRLDVESRDALRESVGGA